MIFSTAEPLMQYMNALRDMIGSVPAAGCQLGAGARRGERSGGAACSASGAICRFHASLACWSRAITGTSSMTSLRAALKRGARPFSRCAAAY
ncbi:MAG: hypothetical protein HND48_17375 [Chloroflexi bacterium]|nr:hypothetical protein [Chloroflexota bacterium]